MPDFNEVLKRSTQGIGEIAKQFSSSQFFKNVVPTSEEFGKELNNYINSNQKIKTSYIQGELDGAVRRAIERPLAKMGVSAEEIKNIEGQLSNALNGTDYSDEALDSLAEIMKKHNIEGQKFEAFKKNASNNIKAAMNASHDFDIKPSVIEGVYHPKTYASTYFNNPDQTIKKQRIAAVAGTYAGIAVGARALSGGNLTHDEYGQKNIAGIPFI